MEGNSTEYSVAVEGMTKGEKEEGKMTSEGIKVVSDSETDA